MARPVSGTLHTHHLADQTRAFHLRVRYQGERPRIVLHEREDCLCGCGGGWDEPAARTELSNILARIRVGVWKPPTPVPAFSSDPERDDAGRVPLFRDYTAWWLQARITGEIGRKPIAENTARDARTQLRHLNAFFGRYRLDEIDRDLCRAFKRHKLQEASEIREALTAGADLRDHRNRRLKPLGPATLRKLITSLAAILDEAIEDDHIHLNPARGRRMAVHVPKPDRTFLEMDELALLLDVAADQDRVLAHGIPNDAGPTARQIAGLLQQGLRPAQIASRLNLARSTIAFHTQRLGARVSTSYVGRRVVCEILGRSGIRASELCDIRIGHVRLHDPDGARFRIPDSKTETGIREVQMSPDLVEAVVEHLDRLQRAGHSTGPDDYLVQNLRGGRMDRQRVGSIVGQAAREASERQIARGLPPLPRVTPHTLRRTYISIALLANQFDVKWVMGQVGHADSKMTMDVYAQLEQRVDRSHGTNFDRLIAKAAQQLQPLTA